MSGYLEILNVTDDHYASLSDAEQRELIQEKISDLKPEDCEDFKDEVKDAIRQKTEDYRELLKDLGKALRSKHVGDDHKEDLKDKKEELKTILDEIHDILPEVSKACKELAERNPDYTDGKDVAISDLDLDGGNYTYKLKGGFSFDFFKTDENKLEGITNDGTKDGVVIKDVNGDTVMNYADIEAALKESPEEISNKQQVFIRTNPNWTWTLVPSSNLNTTTFKVTDEKGESAFVNFENDGDAMYVFNSGLTESYMEQVKTFWTPELQKRTYLGNDPTQSLYEHLNPEQVDQDKKLNAIKGRKQAMSGLDEVAPYLEQDLSEPLKVHAQDALNELFGFIDKGQTNIADTWHTIKANWKDAGLSSADQAQITKALIFDVYNNANQHFSTFFGKVIAQAETLIAYNGVGSTNQNGSEQLDTSDKLAILLLNTQMEGAVGNFGGNEIFNNYIVRASDDLDGQGEVIQGKWTNTRTNEDALKKYKQMVLNNGGTLAVDIDQLIDQQLQAESTSERIELDYNSYQSMISFATNEDALEDHDGEAGSGIEEEDLARELPQMLSIVYNGGSPIPVDIARKKIIEALNADTWDQADDIAAAFLYTLGKKGGDKGREFLTKLLDDQSFKDTIWNIINKEVAGKSWYEDELPPSDYDYARKLLGKKSSETEATWYNPLSWW